MNNYSDQIDDMKQIVANIALHLAYNHPTEAIKMLNRLSAMAQDLKNEINND